MKKSLYIANTPFQIITSILIQESFPEYEADIIVTNLMRNADVVISKLKNIGTFDNVLLYSVPQSKNDMAIELIKQDTIKHILPDTTHNRILVCMSCLTIDINHICYDILLRRNKNLQICGYDEGYSSYSESFFHPENKLSGIHKGINALSRVLFHRKFLQKFDYLFVYMPEMIKGKVDCQVIDISCNGDVLDNSRRKKIFEAFGYVSEENIISDKYIFFEECFSEDLKKNDDIAIVEKIGQIVGKENILIKRHPRNKENRFQKIGYNTILNQEIPWEIYELDEKQPQHTLITFSSGAAINFRFLTSRKEKTVLLYKCYENTNFSLMSEDTQNWFLSYANRYQKDVYLPLNENDLEFYLSKKEDK